MATFLFIRICGLVMLLFSFNGKQLSNWFETVKQALFFMVCHIFSYITRVIYYSNYNQKKIKKRVILYNQMQWLIWHFEC